MLPKQLRSCMHVVLSVHHLRKTLFPGQIFGYEPHIATRITLVLHWTFEMLTGQAIAPAAQAGDRSRSARLALDTLFLLPRWLLVVYHLTLLPQRGVSVTLSRGQWCPSFHHVVSDADQSCSQATCSASTLRALGSTLALKTCLWPCQFLMRRIQHFALPWLAQPD